MKDLVIKTTLSFGRQTKKLVTADALEELYDYLEAYPDAGKIISRTGGVRKLRWKTGKNHRGKSGGVRVLYHYSKDILILLIALYAKSEKENITKEECNELKCMIPQLVAKYREDLQNG